MKIFEERYRQSGTALAFCGNQSTSDIKNLDLTDWTMEVPSDWLSRLPPISEQACPNLTEGKICGVEDMACETMLCCPEDHQCVYEDCMKEKKLCPRCKVPVCTKCMHFLQANEVGPEFMINDARLLLVTDVLRYERLISESDTLLTNDP